MWYNINTVRETKPTEYKLNRPKGRKRYIMSITMNIHIQDGAVRIFGSDLELANASAVDKAAFDAIINAIDSAFCIPSVTDCNTRTDNWEDERHWVEDCDEDDEEDWEDDEEEDEEDGEQNKEEELKKAIEKLKEIFGQ